MWCGRLRDKPKGRGRQQQAIGTRGKHTSCVALSSAGSACQRLPAPSAAPAHRCRCCSSATESTTLRGTAALHSAQAQASA